MTHIDATVEGERGHADIRLSYQDCHSAHDQAYAFDSRAICLSASGSPAPNTSAVEDVSAVGLQCFTGGWRHHLQFGGESIIRSCRCGCRWIEEQPLCCVPRHAATTLHRVEESHARRDSTPRRNRARSSPTPWRCHSAQLLHNALCDPCDIVPLGTCLVSGVRFHLFAMLDDAHGFYARSLDTGPQCHLVRRLLAIATPTNEPTSSSKPAI